ncbi:MAG: hypothetical protein ACK413_00625, partial [Patescibacteria group bacterium]
MAKMIRKKIILAVIFLFFFLNSHQTSAASITNSEVRLSDPIINHLSIYDFEGDLSGQPIKCLYVDFCTTSSGECNPPPGLTTATGSKASSELWNGFTYSNWSYTSLDANTFKITSSIADSPTNDASWAIQNITNSSQAGTYFARINTYANENCTGNVDSGVVAFLNISEGVGVSVIVGGGGGGGGGGGNPLPILTSIDPSSVIVNSPGFIMNLTGSNFISSSIVRFNGLNRATTYINENTLQAEILETDLQNVGIYPITVFNPPPGGGESNALLFQVVP